MEHVNNDMDDLFKKAGDNYPLRTTDSDWDAVFGKLKQEMPGEQTSGPESTSRRTGNKRWWLVLLLLIPVTIGSMLYYLSGRTTPGSKSVVSVSAEKEKGKKRSAADSTQVQSFSKSKDVTENSISRPDKLKTDDVHDKLTPSGSLIKKHTGRKRSSDEHLRVSQKADLSVQKVSTKNNSGAGKQRQTNKNSNLEDATGTEVIGGTASVTAKPESQLAAGSVQETNTGSVSQTKNKTDSLTTSADSSATGKNTAVKKTKTQSKSFSGFYAGLLAGPQFSSIDFQCVKPPGYSLGILIGYRINKHLAIESGVLWDKMFYYSKGEYFDKSKTNIQPGHEILAIDGNCNMFEIPIGLRYDFNSSGHHGYFAKAGLSTYLMKKENYNYTATYAGTSYPGNRSYSNSGNNVFSILEISGGYERAISGKTKIRIEPYVKIPLQGIGIGSMPISSAGFYLGIIHSFR